MTILSRSFVLIAFHAATVSAEGNAVEPQPLIVAHRGLLRHAPENTLANFRACLELRSGCEFDVERAKDGRLICIHDDTVDRTTNGTGKVTELTLAKIKSFQRAVKWKPCIDLESGLSLLPENAPGDIFVDATCFDCDACQQIAPTIFAEAAETAFVHPRPKSSDVRRSALHALLSCPTGAMGCVGNFRNKPKRAANCFNRGARKHRTGGQAG